jgi:hypothetical protein
VKPSGDPVLRNPITGIAGCSAPAAKGNDRCCTADKSDEFTPPDHSKQSAKIATDHNIRVVSHFIAHGMRARPSFGSQ